MKTRNKQRAMSKAKRALAPVTRSDGLLAEVRGLIAHARHQTARMVDAGLTLLYWQVGDRIRRDVLRQKRAGYAEKIVSALGRQLEREFGRGFSEKSLRHMIRFAEAFPDVQIVSALRRQLSAGACAAREGAQGGLRVDARGSAGHPIPGWHVERESCRQPPPKPRQSLKTSRR